MKHKLQLLFVVAIMLMVFNGCTMVSANRVFPKLVWVWSDDAKAERNSRAEQRAYAKEWKRQQLTNHSDATTIINNK